MLKGADGLEEPGRSWAHHSEDCAVADADYGRAMMILSQSPLAWDCVGFEQMSPQLYSIETRI